MNKKAIWFIIGLMTAALIGIVLLQMYWINWSIKLNQDRFDVDVYSVLNRVTEKLQRAEEVKDGIDILNIDEDWKKEIMKQVDEGGENGLTLETTVDGTILMDSAILGSSLNKVYAKLGSYNNDCTCADCQRERTDRYERIVNHMERQKINKLLNPDPITHRININYLDEFIRKELKNMGIFIQYDYGIYSDREKSFVIRNGFYVVKDDSPHSVTPGWRDLYNSDYRVDLFPKDIQSPGLLMIYFPGKASVVWKKAWPTLLASIIFTGIILFCFTYTIQVIFRQKNLSEMKTDFINNMTHEFKTPIATISLAADSITSPMISGNPDKVNRFATIIKQENKRMNSQVEKVLQMAVIDKQDFQLRHTQLDLHDIIRQAARNATLQVEKKKGSVTTNLKAKVHMIEGDMTHVSNIINNLLENANKYSPEKPEISVHTRNVPNGVEVIVQDKGIGMSKEARKHIFDKFYRVHTGNLHDVKGFGLGLSYVKAMMTAHKGQIDVKSELGKGSSFILIFPFNIDPVL